MQQLRRSRSQAIVVLAVERVDEIDLAPTEFECLNVTVRLYVHPYSVQVRQLPPRGIALPIVRVSLQQNVRAGLVICDIKESQHCRLLCGQTGGQNGNKHEDLA